MYSHVNKNVAYCLRSHFKSYQFRWWPVIKGNSDKDDSTFSFLSWPSVITTFPSQDNLYVPFKHHGFPCHRPVIKGSLCTNRSTFSFVSCLAIKALPCQYRRRALLTLITKGVRFDWYRPLIKGIRLYVAGL